jgi:hypothetical protein
MLLGPCKSDFRVDTTYRSRNTTKTKEMHQCMNTFLIVDMVIPEHIRIRNIRHRMSLVTAIDARELDRISDEKHRQTVKDKILVSFLGKELHGPATNITDGVGSTSFTSSSRDTTEKRGLLSLAAEELGVGDIGEVFCDFKLSPCSGCLCVDYTFRNAFAREMCQSFDELRIR